MLKGSFVAALVAAFLTVGGYADSEYDGKRAAEQPPQLVIERIDVKEGKATATRIAVKSSDPDMTEAKLEKMGKEERQKAIEAFLAKAEKEGKVELTEVVTKAEKATAKSEYDEKSSTGQFHGRFYGRGWGYYGRGGYGYGGWGVRNFGYGGVNYGYYPRFGYGGGGCYNPCWQPPVVVQQVWVPPPPPVIVSTYYTVYGLGGYCD